MKYIDNNLQRAEDMRILQRTKDLTQKERVLYMEGYADAIEYMDRLYHLERKYLKGGRKNG